MPVTAGAETPVDLPTRRPSPLILPHPRPPHLPESATRVPFVLGHHLNFRTQAERFDTERVVPK